MLGLPGLCAHEATRLESSSVRILQDRQQQPTASNANAIHHCRLPPKEELLPVVRPDWGKEGDLSSYDSEIKATWLGHACFLVEFPSAQPGQRGYRVLLDP